MTELTPDEHKILVDAIHDSATVIHKGQIMNERIRQLYYDCQDESQSTESCYQKFAELIVRECYEECKGQMLPKGMAEEHGLNYNDGVMDCAIGLLQHFGVEDVGS